MVIRKKKTILIMSLVLHQLKVRQIVKSNIISCIYIYIYIYIAFSAVYKTPSPGWDNMSMSNTAPAMMSLDIGITFLDPLGKE